MPVEFLSDEQAGAFGRFDGEPSQIELERFFFLDDADLERTSAHRGDHNRLGFAVQLGTVRFLGLFLTDALDVPWCVVDYLAGQLGVSDPSVVKRYSERVQTAHDHAREIRRAYGFRDFMGPLVDELGEFLYSRAWTRGEGPTALFGQAVGWLRKGRVLLPKVTTIARLVAAARDRATTEFYDRLTSAAGGSDPQLAARLRGLLIVDDSSRASRLEVLRAGPVRLSGPAMNKALVRVEHLLALGVGAVDTSKVPAARLRALARYGTEAKAQ